jgi:hypothetical protein
MCLTRVPLPKYLRVHCAWLTFFALELFIALLFLGGSSAAEGSEGFVVSLDTIFFFTLIILCLSVVKIRYSIKDSAL